jgi:hypothetical protein
VILPYANSAHATEFCRIGHIPGEGTTVIVSWIVGLPSPGTTRPPPRRSMLCYPSRSVTLFPTARWHLSNPSNGRNVGRRVFSPSLLRAICSRSSRGYHLKCKSSSTWPTSKIRTLSLSWHHTTSHIADRGSCFINQCSFLRH